MIVTPTVLPQRRPDETNDEYVEKFIVQHPYSRDILQTMLDDLYEVDPMINIQHIRHRSCGNVQGISQYKFQIMYETNNEDIVNDLQVIVNDACSVVTALSNNGNDNKRIQFVF